MNDFNNIFDQIPIQYNLLSFFTFAGIVVGFMISLTILFKKKQDNQAVYFLGAIVLFTILILLDFFLSQTGLMKYVLWLNNSTEVFALLIPICAYFFILEILNPEKRATTNFKLHLLMPCLYFLIQIGIFFQPKAVRLNDYLSGFHPDLPLLEVDTAAVFHLPYFICQFFHEFLIITFLVYLFFLIKTIQAYNQKMKQYFATQKPKRLKYNLSILLVIFLGIATFLIAVIFINFQTDLGEKYLMLIPLFGIFAIGFLMLSGAPFFDKSWLLEKYHTSGLNISSSDILRKIIGYVENEKYYLKKDGSLKDLATQLVLSPTYLSQVINNQTHQNFNDFINQYRIEEAKKRLVDKAYQHLTIAGIGETVGFKSKSSFYSVFKKHTDLSPAAYINAVKM